MAGEKREGARRWAATIAGVLATLPLLYVLSLGPAVFLYERGRLSEKQLDRIESFYEPLETLSGQSPWLNQSLMWYADQWR